MNLVAASQAIEIGALPPHHWQAGLTLLTPLAGEQRLPRRIVGAHIQGHPERLVGAAAFLPDSRGTESKAALAWIRVLGPWQGQGIGRRLMHRLRAEAADWDVGALRSIRPVYDRQSVDALTAMDCRSREAVHHFIAQDTEAVPILRTLVARLRDRGRVPPDEQVRRLHEVPMAEVIDLHACHFGQSPAASRRVVEAAIRTAPGNTLSFALWDGHRVTGALIAGGSTELPEVAFWFGRPDRRDGAAAILTLHAFVEGVRALGLHQGRFSCHESARATVNVARKLKARLEAVAHHWEIGLSNPSLVAATRP
jgi:GNAT superfamily N-acetyltransferase